MLSVRNDHLSYSRLTRFEQCPFSYKLHYLDCMPAEPNSAAQFGKAIHAVLEQLVREHVEQKQTGRLSEEQAVMLWQQAFMDHNLAGFETFIEGADCLKLFVRKHGEISASQILAIEKPFELAIGHHKIIGFIDRVDRLDDKTIEIIDYKTNRMLFNHEELHHNLQMSLYCLAAKKLWLDDSWQHRLEAECIAELEQAHGRLRAVHRTKPGRALHIGFVIPGGIGWKDVKFRKLPVGRPKKEKTAMTADKVKEIVDHVGSMRKVAKAVGVSPTTIARYIKGSPINDNLAKALSALISKAS